MRARSSVVLLLTVVLMSALPAFAASSFAFAQEQETDQGDPATGTDTGSETSDTSGDTGDTDSDEGSGTSEAETGANEGQVEGSETETGPPWTYQMAWITLALLLLMALAMGALYWKLVVQRQRRGI